MNHGLSHQSQTHLAQADIEVEGAGALPTQALVKAEELLDVPAARKIPGQGRNFGTSRCTGEGLVVVILSPFSGALDVAITGLAQGASRGNKALHCNGEASPVSRKLLGRTIPVTSRLRSAITHWHQQIKIAVAPNQIEHLG